jgi:hypothetical protein
MRFGVFSRLALHTIPKLRESAIDVSAKRSAFLSKVLGKRHERGLEPLPLSPLPLSPLPWEEEKGSQGEGGWRFYEGGRK